MYARLLFISPQFMDAPFHFFVLFFLALGVYMVCQLG